MHGGFAGHGESHDASGHERGGERHSRRKFGGGGGGDANTVWVGSAWHMQTPLELVGADTCVVLELMRHGDDGADDACAAWARIPLNKARATTRHFNVSMLAAPVNLRKGKAVPIESFISGEIVVHQTPPDVAEQQEEEKG